MRTRLLLVLPLLSASALAACSVQETTRDTTSAYTVDEPSPAAPLDGTCASVADTGDMYRYCMQYGPQQALAIEHRSPQG